MILCSRNNSKATKLQTTGNNLVRSIKATYFHDMSYQFLCFGEKGVRQHCKFGQSIGRNKLLHIFLHPQILSLQILPSATTSATIAVTVKTKVIVTEYHTEYSVPPCPGPTSWETTFQYTRSVTDTRSVVTVRTRKTVTLQ